MGISGRYVTLPFRLRLHATFYQAVTIMHFPISGGRDCGYEVSGFLCSTSVHFVAWGIGKAPHGYAKHLRESFLNKPAWARALHGRSTLLCCMFTLILEWLAAQLMFLSSPPWLRLAASSNWWNQRKVTVVMLHRTEWQLCLCLDAKANNVPTKANGTREVEWVMSFQNLKVANISLHYGWLNGRVAGELWKNEHVQLAGPLIRWNCYFPMSQENQSFSNTLEKV